MSERQDIDESGQYFLLGKLYVNELHRPGSFVLGKSDSILELRSLADRLDLCGVLKNMIIVDGGSKSIVWKCKSYDVRPPDGIHTEFYRWLMGVGNRCSEEKSRLPFIEWLQYDER